MREKFEKILLLLIYIGFGIALATPLLVDNHFFFPFISTKVFLFRTVVEILVLLYLGLNFFSTAYRPRLNWLLGFLSAFILIAAIASYFGPNFYRSFWGDIERGEGLILWLHLWAFFVILTGVLRQEKIWAAFMDVSVGASFLMALFGLGQFLNLPLLLNTSGVRVDATLGNAAFFGAYLLFHIAFAAYLFHYRQSRVLKGYYLVAALFFAWVTTATETRGAVLGLVGGALVAALLFVWTIRDNPRVRKLSLGLIVALVVVASGLYLVRNSSFVKNTLRLQRVLEISTQERTAQTRLATWQAGWSGWKEKFVLGWGLENFDVVFNKYFPRIIYQDEGSQIWFDRGHDIFFDRGVTTGLLGLLAFLGFLLTPAYFVLRRGLRDPQKRTPAIIIAGFIVAYFIQDLFVFESIATYILLMFAWAFFASILLPNFAPERALRWPYLWLGLTGVYAVFLWPILWNVNFYPAHINRLATQAVQMNPQTDDFFKIVDTYKQSIDAPTYGQEEYRLQFIEFVDQQLANAGAIIEAAKPVLAYTDDEAQKQVRGGVEDAKNWLLAMRHYNYTYAALPGQEIPRLQEALTFYPQLHQLSPPRPQVSQEAGYTHLYLYRIYKGKGDTADAAAQLQQAKDFFNQTVALSYTVPESYINMIMLYLNSGDDAGVQSVIDLMDQRQVNFRTATHLNKLLDLSKANNNLRWIGYFSEQLTNLNPQDVNGWINLAVFYATSGNRQKAIEIANKIKTFGGDYVSQADLFIQNVNKGVYEQKK